MKKTIGYIVSVIVAAGAGFYGRNLMPAGSPPQGAGGPPQMPPTAVNAVKISKQPLELLDSRIANVEPLQEVIVKSEVSGYIDSVHFVEGSTVKEGDLLFTVDRKKYEALYQVKVAELASANAELSRANKLLKRMQNAGARSVSQSDLEKTESEQLKAVALVKQAEANLSLAKLISIIHKFVRQFLDKLVKQLSQKVTLFLAQASWQKSCKQIQSALFSQ